MKEHATWRGALAKSSLAVSLGMSSCSYPVSPTYLPDNPCASLQPLNTATLHLQSLEAPGCSSFLNAGKEVIVDFAHL
ncbi:MAG TPA: hypothetical protein VND99_01955, partial [Candidatus Acidoferrales bacterium]|nr:hypothetical protein [Candidatus Acidoferrales bacterium]